MSQRKERATPHRRISLAACEMIKTNSSSRLFCYVHRKGCKENKRRYLPSETNIIYRLDSAYVVTQFGSSNNKVTNVYSLGQLEGHFEINSVWRWFGILSYGISFVPLLHRVPINYRTILQNHIFTNTEHKYMMLLPFERGMFAVS